MSADENSPKKKRKRGVVNSFNYRHNVIKRAKIHGEEHSNWKGNLVPAKNTTQINKICCKKQCLDACDQAILEDMRQVFYEMESKDEQDLHLQRLIEITETARPRPRVGTSEDKRKPKTKTPSYHLLVDRVRVKVCKVAFMNVHNITKNQVERIVNLLEQDITPKDKRGKHFLNRKMVSADVCKLIKLHIQSYPVKEAHYSSREVRYLSADLNVKIMYNMFLVKHPELKGVVKYQFYWEYLKKNFSLSFGRPAQDTCCKCEELQNKMQDKNLNAVAKRVAAAELLVHKNRANKFYKQLKASAELSKEKNSTILAICFDFMAVLDLPKIPVQDSYYFRQLSVNTFGIYNLRDEKITTYVYHEGTARKTPDDVTSFVMHYINNFVGEEIDELHLFCDNCGGQNKNHAFIRGVMTLVEMGIVKKVKAFFPIRGHSFLPCDRAFGLIKRKLRKMDRLFTLDEYIDVIRSASNIPEKFKILKVEPSIIFDYQNWFKEFFYKQTSALESRVGTAQPAEKFLISKYHFFECDSSDHKVLRASEYLSGLVTWSFKLRKSNVNSVILPTKLLYPGKNPILTNKMTDLLKFNEYIPVEAKTFWTAIFQWPTETTEARQARFGKVKPSDEV